MRYKIRPNSASKDFIKTFPTYFAQIYLQHFSNRPYSNVKIFLAYLYIIEIVWNSLPLQVFNTFLALLRVLLALNFLSFLDCSNKSPCLYAVLRILFLNGRCFFSNSNFQIFFQIECHQQSMIWKAIPWSHCYFLFHFWCYVAMNKKNKCIEYIWHNIKSK